MNLLWRKTCLPNLSMLAVVFASSLSKPAAGNTHGKINPALLHDDCCAAGPRACDLDGFCKAEQHSFLQMSSNALPVAEVRNVLMSSQRKPTSNMSLIAHKVASVVPIPDRSFKPAPSNNGLGPNASAGAIWRSEMEKVAVPIAAVIFGGLLILCRRVEIGLIAVYFGSQSGLSLYMKLLLSTTLISQELDLRGFPAPFLVTAAQQFIAFFVILPVAVVSARWRASGVIKQVKNSREWAAVLLFSLAFAGNIGLNNLSLSLIAVSLNLIIRSCLPIATFLAEKTMSQMLPCDGGEFIEEPTQQSEVILMVAGVLFAGLATVASSDTSPADDASFNYLFGVGMCVLSVVAASLNLVLTKLLGANMQFNPVDALVYTSIPCAAFLMVPVLMIPHPVAWANYQFVTDWEVLRKVAELSPSTLAWVLVSGCFAAAYNLLQYMMVNYLSPTHTAFCGNFNKAATIALSLLMGFENLPGGVWSAMMVIAIVGNIFSFTGFSLIKARGKTATKM